MNKIRVIEFTDPACTWCWGSEPILRKLEVNYQNQIEVDYIMGGLVEDVNDFHDSANQIFGSPDEINEKVAVHWLEASERHGMPVKVEGFSLFSAERRSTYPMNIAYKAAQFQDKKLAKKLLRRIREAVAAEGRKTNQTEVLIELAQEVGLDVPKFIKAFTDGSAEKAFYEDKKITVSNRVSGFPSYLVTDGQDKNVLLRGYQQYETFKEVIEYLSDNEVHEHKIKFSPAAVEDFIRNYGRVAPIEILMAFDIKKSDLDIVLKDLNEKGSVDIEIHGNGSFIVYKSHDEMACDPSSGMCF